MRNELENIELIERYINNELSAEELTQVESKLVTDSEFKDQLKTQQNLQIAVSRSALRSEMISAGKTVVFKNKLKKWIIGSVVVVAAAGSMFYLMNWYAENQVQNNQIIDSTELTDQVITTEVNGHSESAESFIIEDDVIGSENVDQGEKIAEFVQKERGVEDENGKNEGVLVGALTSLNESFSVDKTDNVTNINGEKVSPSYSGVIASSESTTGSAGSPYEISTDENCDFSIEDFKQKEQEFTINSSRDTIIFGEEGITVQVPANSFNTRKNGPVTIKMKEFLKLSDMILEGLITTSNGQLIETAGMVHIEAFQNGKKLDSLPGNLLRISFPTPNDNKGFQIFNGEQKDNDSTVNWVAQGDLHLFNAESKLMSATAYAFSFPKYLTKSIGENEINDELASRKQQKKNLISNTIYGKDGPREVSAFGNRKTKVYTTYPNTVDHDGLTTRANTAEIGYLYHKLLDKGCLPKGIITFQLSNTNKASNFELHDNKDQSTDSMFLALQHHEKWTVIRDFHFSINKVNVPKKKIVILDLDFKKYIDHPGFGPKIKDILAEKGMSRPDVNAATMFKVLKMGWVNCDRFLGSNKNVKDMAVTGPKYFGPTLVYKSIRSLLNPERVSHTEMKFKNVPREMEVALISITHEDDGIYVNRKDVYYQGEKQEMGPSRKVNVEEFKKFLDDLDNIHKKTRKK